MNTTFSAVNTATEIIKNLTELKVSNGIAIEMGKVGEERGVIRHTTVNAQKGYNQIRKGINDDTMHWYDEKCYLTVNGQTMYFLGGKFSNELLKVLELTANKYFVGHHFDQNDKVKYQNAIVKTAFLSDNITIVDLMPIAAKFSGLSKKEIAQLAIALSEHESFREAVVTLEAKVSEALEAQNAETQLLEKEIEENATN